MPKPFNIDTVADAAWAIIQAIPEYRRTKRLKAHLGTDGAAIVGRHFSVGWLDRIKVNATASRVPVPTLDQLAGELGFAGATALKAAGMAADAELYMILDKFAKGKYLGITYDKVIMLPVWNRDDLATTVHELVHTIQWDRFGPTVFLKKYLNGFRGGTAYRDTPAEKRAYHFSDEFERRTRSLFTTKLRKSLSKYTVTEMQKLMKAAGKDPKDLQAFTATMSAMAVTKPSAVLGM